MKPCQKRVGVLAEPSLRNHRLRLAEIETPQKKGYKLEIESVANASISALLVEDV